MLFIQHKDIVIIVFRVIRLLIIKLCEANNFSCGDDCNVIFEPSIAILIEQCNSLFPSRLYCGRCDNQNILTSAVHIRRIEKFICQQHCNNSFSESYNVSKNKTIVLTHNGKTSIYCIYLVFQTLEIRDVRNKAVFRSFSLYSKYSLKIFYVNSIGC